MVIWDDVQGRGARIPRDTESKPEAEAESEATQVTVKRKGSLRAGVQGGLTLQVLC